LLRETAEPSTPSGGSAAQPAKLSPGMATLLRLGDENHEPETPGSVFSETPRTEPKRLKVLLRISLVLADALLVFLAVRLVVLAHGPLDFLGVALCVAAVIAGAWLSCLAFLL
jgi:hypothetical protein